jgi:hypothetical protein
MSETEFPNAWDFTPEQRDVLQQAFENDPVATMSAIAHAAGQVAFQQSAQLSGQQNEAFRDSVFDANLSRATDEIAATVGYEAYNAALPKISELWGEDPNLIGPGQDYETIKNRLAGLFNSAAVGLDFKNPKEAEDKATWDRIKNAPGTKSYQDLAEGR